MPLDSLHIADTLLLADTIPADSLFVPAPPAAPVDTLMVGPQGIFGQGSALAQAAQTGVEAAHISLTDNIVVKGAVLLIFIFYCLVIALYGSQLRSLAGLAAGRKGTNRLLDQQGNLTQNFIRIALWMAIPTLILIALKAVDMQMLPIPKFIPPGPVLTLAVGGATVAALVPILLYQWLMIRIAGRVTNQTAFMQRLQMLRRFICALGSVSLTPLVIFWTVSGAKGAPVLAFIVAGVACLISFLLILRTLQLFSEQKVSFLYWILYLCAVEIFPVSLIVLLAIR